MDKLNHYRSLIKKILTEYEELASKTPNPEGVDSLLAFDEKRDQYLWFRVGWTPEERIKGISVHIRIKNDKIYIEEDWTEEGIATELLREGVPKEDIEIKSFYLTVILLFMRHLNIIHILVKYKELNHYKQEYDEKFSNQFA